MKKSLGRKIGVIGITMLTAFVILNIVLTYFFMIPFSVYLSTKQMEKIAITMINEDSYVDEEFMEYVEKVSEDMNTSVTVIDGDKNIICTTKVSEYHHKALGKSTAATFDENREELDKGNTVSMSRNKERDNSNLILVHVIKKVTDDRYVILGRTYGSLENATHSAIIFDLIAGGVIIILGIFFVVYVTRYLVVPIRNMQVTAEHISNLEFDTRVEVNSQDELGQLGMSINRMSDYLEENLEQLQKDIENRKRLVRNISHEIKSPVAVIMGYADRLKATILKNPERAMQYCEIISNESARIDVLVREMLELSRFEQKTEELNEEVFQVRCLFENVRNCFREESIERNIAYEEEYGSADCIKGDFLLLERALNNLVRNAVAHGTGDEMRIRVSGRENGEYYEFRVFNTGSHIDDEDVEIIWDAFSKADKARTRGKGFGVGLSIVREIVLAHNGYCAVENTPDGVEFLIAVKIS